MKDRGVHLQYSFQARSQRGAEVHNPLFELLSAIAEHGSILHAAKAMGASYRHVWGACKHWEGVLGEPLLHWAQGQPARLTPFAERLLWAEKRARSRLVPHIEALRAELEHVLAQALDGDQQLLSVHASHDLALPLLREFAAAPAAGDEQRLHIELKFSGSIDALHDLAAGRCAVAGFHVPPLAHSRTHYARALKPLLEPGRHKLIGCMQRMQGLIVARGNPLQLRAMADVVARHARFVQRQPGSGTRLLAEHLLAELGLDEAELMPAHATAEDSHLAVAAAIASGIGDCALGIEAAARSFGLDFVPVIEEQYFLVCLTSTLEQPAVQTLRRRLQQAHWAQLLSSLPGYRSERAGEVLSLTRALPWWHFRTAKRADRRSAKRSDQGADGPVDSLADRAQDAPLQADSHVDIQGRNPSL